MIRVKHCFRAAAVSVCILMLTGCVTGRATMALETPPAQGSSAGDNGRIAVVTSVLDQRRFEEKPAEPSTPSLKRGDKYQLDEQGRKQAIARMRNTYGMAMGDIVLDGNVTVEDLTRELIVNGLEQQGYRVVADAADAPPDALRVSALIREFWAWFTPGMFAASMEARVATTLTLAGEAGSREISVEGYGRNSVQMARPENWRLTYRRAFEDYLEKQQAALRQR